MPAHVRRSFAICLLVLPFVLLGQASPAAAAALTWAGPDGGRINSLALQPGSSKILYAGTSGGVFKSFDGGATWLPPGEGPPNTNVLEVAVDPAHPATVYAALAPEGVHKSTDGGAHWTDIGEGFPAQPFRPTVYALAVAPSGAVYAGTSMGVFRSLKGDGSWQPLNRGLLQGRAVFALEIDPSRPERMYAGLSEGIFRSNDGGARWARLGGAAVTGGVHEIAVSPASPNVIYAATSSGVARSLDSGATWLPPRQGLTGDLTSLAAHPTLSGTVYAGTSEGVFRSGDRGETWTPASEGLSDPFVLTLVIDPAHPATLWAGTASLFRLGGVFQTTDAGAHWTFHSNGLDAATIESVAIDPHTPGTLFAALGSRGLFRSRDRGLHWTPLPVPEGIAVLDVEVDPVNPSIVYAAVSNNGPLLKSTDGGDTWTRHGTSPSGLAELEIDPANPSVFHGGSGFSGFYRSTDAGATWVQSPSSPFVSTRQIVIAPGVLYAIGRLPPVGGTPGANLTQMFRSTDAGQTWQVVIHFDQSPHTLAVSPSDPKTVYVALRSGMILRSTDGGDTWQNVIHLVNVSALAVAPGSPETLYAALSGQGVYASTDGGANWFPVMRGHAGLSFGKIFLDPQDPGRLYVTTLERGLLVLHEPEECEPGPAVLCLQGNRFQIEAAWTDFQGNNGLGQPILMTNETGGLWFFDPGNVELVVKVLDGRGTNGRFWVFVASLTSVELTLTVTDTETGVQKVYYNPSGHMASFADTDTF